MSLSLVLLCGILIRDVEGVRQDSNIRPSRAYGKMLPAHLVLPLVRQFCLFLSESFVGLIGKFCLSVSPESCVSLFCWKVLSVSSGVSVTFVASVELN